MSGPRNKAQAHQLNDNNFRSGGASRLACQPDKAAFHREVGARINDANGVDQSWASLCGAAVAVRALILENPAMYAALAWGLFYNRSATIFGNEFVLSDATADNTDTGSMPSVDYACLASTRESVGWVTKHSWVSVGGLLKDYGGATSMSTPGDVQSYLQRFNFSVDGGRFYPLGRKGIIDTYSTLERLGDLDIAGRKYSHGAWAIFLINATALSDPKASSYVANHWIALDDHLVRQNQSGEKSRLEGLVLGHEQERHPVRFEGLHQRRLRPSPLWLHDGDFKCLTVRPRSRGCLDQALRPPSRRRRLGRQPGSATAPASERPRSSLGHEADHAGAPLGPPSRAQAGIRHAGSLRGDSRGWSARSRAGR